VEGEGMKDMLKDYVFWICMIPISLIAFGLVVIAITGGK
jgi:hypothetical protein